MSQILSNTFCHSDSESSLTSVVMIIAGREIEDSVKTKLKESSQNEEKGNKSCVREREREKEHFACIRDH